MVYSGMVLASRVMKLKHRISPLALPRKQKKHGFALIATLTLMMLLAMLAVALLSLASSQNRVAMQTVMLAEARQQALVGLDAAIAELQFELGPDQRVSANSGILSEAESSKPQYVLGVWNSWDGPIYGKSRSNKADSIQSTYSKGRSNMFRRWLVSAADKDSARQVNQVESLISRKPGSRICMLGEGTLGTSLSARHHIYADLLTMPSKGKNTTCFAWWIGGENTKAKVNVPLVKETEDLNIVLRRTWDTPSPMILNNRDLDFIPQDGLQQPDKIITINSLPLVSTSSQSAGMPYYFDITTSSYSLPVNVRSGGLKHDLCLLLNKKNLQDTDFAVRSDQDCPIAENSDIPKGTEARFPIGSWQSLYAYYNCWPNGTSNDGDNFSARLHGEVANSYTRISGSVMDGFSMEVADDPESVDAGSHGSVFETRARMDQGSKKSGYARTPVMLAFTSNYGLHTARSKKSDRFLLSMTVAPMYLWWNPYNIPMRVRGQQLWSQSAPYTSMWLLSYCYRGNVGFTWGRYGMGYSTDDMVGAAASEEGVSAAFDKLDGGQFFQNSDDDKTGDIVFQPGEVLFFSPGESDNKGQGGSFVLGYQPSNVADYKAHFYTTSRDHMENFHRIGLKLGCYDPEAEEVGLDRELLTGFRLSPYRPEVIGVTYGFNGLSRLTIEEQFNGKRAISPNAQMIGWYDPRDEKISTVIADHRAESGRWRDDGTQSDSVLPFYIASAGVVAKSANMNLDQYVFPGKDFRTKMWQHSNPAFASGGLVNPDDQQRQYNPYQLSALDVSAGLTSSPMDSIGNNGFLGITSDGEQVSFASVLELPVHPPFSLAGLAGMRLQPGWYKTAPSAGPFKAASAMRRMSYHAGVPGVGIGNSFADPCIPAGDVYAFHQTNMPQEGGNGQLYGDFYDHGLLINDAMWDRWFCSSVSEMPGNGKSVEVEDTLNNFLSGKEDLPVARYKKSPTPYSDSQVLARLLEDDGWKYIAQYLMIDGGFNVNSTSVEAWTAVLQGLARRQLVTSDGNKLQLVEKDKTEDQVLFSRFMLSTTDTSIDTLGGYSMMQGSTQFRKSNAMMAAWGEVRKLDPESIRKLAEEMVKQVRLRGPFLNMSDFINRRLDNAGGETALKGALQAAIDATDINKSFQDVVVKPQTNGNMYKFPAAEEGSMYTAAPGYLIQSDVLMALGNVLTVRDDTFTVRSYGCVRNPQKAILAQAWCEAVVQRTMYYVDAANDPYDSEFLPDGRQGDKLSDANKVLGRQFRIVSFKWLDIWDI